MRRPLFNFLFILFAPLLAAPIDPALAAPPALHETAPDFSLTDMQGALHTLAGYRGTVVLLNFWATWRSDCVNEMPSLDTLAHALKKDGLVVIGIAIDRNRSEVEPWTTKVSYPVLLDPHGDVFVKTYTNTRLPMTIIIDRNGVIVKKIAGSADFRAPAFAENMNALLRKPVSP